MLKIKQRNNGFALLLAVIVSSVVLAIGISILNISVSQITLSSTARESEFAFQAAHTGIDCMWYWRNEEAATYEARNGGVPLIECFGNESLDSEGTTLSSPAPDADGHVNAFTYLFEWGDPEDPQNPVRCTSLEMTVMNAHGRDLNNLRFENETVGEDGVKTCLEGNMCTVVFSRGYNRSCDERYSSIFSVQRELTVEF